jgi:hypothetical protein
MEDLIETLTRGNPGSVKTVLASVVLALAAYQVILAAIGYGKLRLMAARPAFFTHRASGDMLVVLIAIVAVMCVAAYGFDDDSAATTSPASRSPPRSWRRCRSCASAPAPGGCCRSSALPSSSCWR